VLLKVTYHKKKKKSAFDLGPATEETPLLDMFGGKTHTHTQMKILNLIGEQRVPLRAAEGMVWFHPDLDRKDAEILLKRADVDGAFLVWHNGGKGRAVLSYFNHKQV
jgi:hypothetical protein